MASNQVQDTNTVTQIKERKAALNNMQPSPAHAKLPAMQVREVENNGFKKGPLSPGANISQQHSSSTSPQLNSSGNVTRSRAPHESPTPSGKSFYRKMEYIDNLLDEMDDNVSFLRLCFFILLSFFI